MKSTKHFYLSIIVVVAIAFSALAGAQTVIPQIADGGGWQTTLVLSNTSAGTTSASVTFFQESGGGATTAWNLAFNEVSSTQNISLPSGGVLIIHSADTANLTTVGWAQVSGDPAIVVYAVFTQIVTGRPNQDCTVLASATSSRVLMPYDNTNGFATSMAIANTGLTAQTITVATKNSSGSTVTQTSITLPPQGHTSFAVPTQYTVTGGASGMAEFTSTGTISVIAIRFNPSGSFTTAPAFPATGAAILGASSTPASGTVAQSVIPQIADGGGWQTTLVLANTSASSTSTSVSFLQDNGGGATSAWPITFLEVGSTQSISLAPGGVMIIHSADSASTTTTGWAQVSGDPAIVVYAVFTQIVAGRPNQDCTVLASAASSRVLMPYDNTNSFVTSMAIINTGSTSQNITVGLENTTGGVVTSAQAPITLPAGGHTSFSMPTQFSATNSVSGMAEFTSTGTISVIAIRFNPSGSFTTAPAFPESGASIIPVGIGGGTPSFTQLNMTAATTNIPSPNNVPAMSINIANGNNGVFTGTVTGKTAGAAGSPATSFTAVWDNVTLSGPNLVFAGFDAGKSNFGGAPFTTATLSVQLTVQFLLTGGTMTGTIDLVSGSTTINGTISGTGTPF